MFVFASEETYRDGKIIYEEGSTGDWVYVVLSGAVEISKTIGGKKFVIEWIRDGEIFGGAGFIGEKDRFTTATAVGVTTVGIVDRAPLDEEFNKLSSNFRAIQSATVNRCKKIIERACSFTSRKKPRFQKILPLTYKYRSKLVKASTSNIGRNGLFIGTENTLGKGEEFSINLQLPGIPKPLKIKCRVVWTRKKAEDPAKRPSGMGVKFKEMSRQDNQMLKQYLKKAGRSPG